MMKKVDSSIDKTLTMNILIKRRNSIISRMNIAIIIMRRAIGMVYWIRLLHQDIIIVLRNKEN